MNALTPIHPLASPAHYTPDATGAISLIHLLQTAEQAAALMVSHPAHEFSTACDDVGPRLTTIISDLRDAMHAVRRSAESAMLLARGVERERLADVESDAAWVLAETA